MRCYLVTNNMYVPKAKKQYAGTQAEVATIKKQAMAEGAKRKDIDVKEVDVPVAKAELIKFINELVAE